jgi:hypothetical protein
MWNKVLILPVPMVKLMQIFIMVKMFDQVAMECDQNEEFYREFSTRLSKVVSMADGTGWGFYEALVECYYTIEWVHEEDE